MRELLAQIRNAFKVQNDIVSYGDIERDILEGIQIGGTNLIILVVAIFIASIGLNVNSTAVVIGAMLISPLMGNIIAIGYGIAIGDYSVTRRGLTGFGFQVIFSIVASTIYFILTPIDYASSELLARTSPTLFDLLIAIFGGVAAIIGIARKSKGNVIPGVAIATALMPPLCTAGYGLGTGNFRYFFGAMYLFSMNAIYIIVATIMVSKFLRLPYKVYETNYERRKKIRNTIIAAIIAAVPSVYLAIDIVGENNIQSNINRYVRDVFDFSDTQVVYSNSDLENMDIEIALLGERIDEDQIEYLIEQKSKYDLDSLEVTITQVEVPEGITQQEIEEIMQNANESQTEVETKIALSEQQIATLTEKIGALEDQIDKLEYADSNIAEIGNEVKALYPNIADVEITIVADSEVVTEVSLKIASSISLTADETAQLEGYLKTRLGVETVNLSYVGEE